MKLERKIHFLLLFIMLVTIVIGTACSQINEKHKGALSIRQNLDKYEVKTTPYEEEIIFELNTSKMLEEIDEPINVTTVHNTALYVTEIIEKDDSIIVLNVGFKYNYQSPSGEMLSLFQLNEDNTFTNSGVNIKMFDETGEEINVARGSGDGEKYGYEQWIGVQIPKDLLKANEKLIFEIGGLNVLSYRELN